MKVSILLCFVSLSPFLFASAFVSSNSRPTLAPQTSTSLFIGGPINKLTRGKDYEKTVEGLMKTKGYSREKAEKEYSSYLDDPNNYALQKGEEYYKGLGYKSLMDGVVGEAEKNGRGEEVKARIADFKKKSQMKAFSVISVALTALVYSKVTFDMDPANHIGNLPM